MQIHAAPLSVIRSDAFFNGLLRRLTIMFHNSLLRVDSQDAEFKLVFRYEKRPRRLPNHPAAFWPCVGLLFAISCVRWQCQRGAASLSESSAGQIIDEI